MIKKLFLFSSLLSSLYAENLTSEDINIAMEFVKIKTVPEIIQQPKYIEDSTNKMNLVFNKTTQMIKGYYVSNQIHMYDLNLDLANTNECHKVEQFIKTGYLVHELTHYKQDIIDNEFFKIEPQYFISHKERGAFDNQIKFYIENYEDKDKDFLSCYRMSSKDWFLKYLDTNKDVHGIFKEYIDNYSVLEGYLNENKNDYIL